MASTAPSGRMATSAAWDGPPRRGPLSVSATTRFRHLLQFRYERRAHFHGAPVRAGDVRKLVLGDPVGEPRRGWRKFWHSLHLSRRSFGFGGGLGVNRAGLNHCVKHLRGALPSRLKVADRVVF